MRHLTFRVQAWIHLRVWLRLGAEAEDDGFDEVARLAHVHWFASEFAIDQVGARLCAI